MRPTQGDIVRGSNRRMHAPAVGCMIAYCGGGGITYTLVFSAGVLLALLWLAFQPPNRSRRGNASGDLLPAAVAALAGGLLGARLLYVLAYPGHYAAHPLQVLWLWQGGLSGAGGMLGALAGLAGYARVTRTPFPRLGDALAIPALVIAASAWTGCWLEGCAYGFALDTRSPLLVTWDMFGGMTARWPAALIGVTPVLAALLLLLRPGVERWRRGCGGAVSWSGVALGMLLASIVRADPIPIALNLRLDTIAGALLTIAGASAFLLCYRGERTPGRR